MLAVEKITVPIVFYMEVSNSFCGGKIFLRNHILVFFLSFFFIDTFLSQKFIFDY